MLNVILDIDGTLVDTREASTRSTYPHTTIPSLPGYHVFIRPYLDEFLQWLFKNFSVSVWTAGSEPYARWISEHVIGRKTLRHILSARDCQASHDVYKNLKSLNYLSNIDPTINRRNTLLIDDSFANCTSQQNNCVLVQEFNATVSGDSELKYLPERIIKQFDSIGRRRV